MDKEAAILAMEPVVSIIASIFTRRLSRFGVQFEDLRGVGRVAVAKAACRYNESTNVPFSAFARHSINGAIKDFIRKSTGKRKAHVHQGPTITYFADLGASIPTRYISTPGGMESISDGISVRQLMALTDLTEREQQVIIDTYWTGLTMHEIAGIRGITEGRVSQLHKAALSRLRGSMSNEEVMRFLGPPESKAAGA